MVNRAHVIDPDVGRRARISRELSTFSLHTEIYEDIDEFLDVRPTRGFVLAADEGDARGQHFGELLKTPGIYLPIVCYGEEPSTEKVVEAMMAGAAGFLRWPFGEREFVKTLNRISEQGEQRLRRERTFSRAKVRVDSLSSREKQVLTGLIGGMSNKQIAQMLEISPRTVEIHRSNMMSKLRARSVADAVKTGLFAGLDHDLYEPQFTEAA